MDEVDGVPGAIPPSWTSTSRASSSSNSTIIRAGEDCQWIFDPVGTTYNTKADWIETSNTKACSHGFRLYVGEGRALKTKKPSATSGRLELACWKYRGKDAQGRRTRAGGCRFKLKGREVESSDGSAQWQLVGGIFTHTHDCELAELPTRMSAAAKTTTRKKKATSSAAAKRVPDSAADNSPSASSSAATDRSPVGEQPSDSLAQPSDGHSMVPAFHMPAVDPPRTASPAYLNESASPSAYWYPASVPPVPALRAQSYDAYTPYPFQAPQHIPPHFANPPNPSSYLLRAIHGHQQQQQAPHAFQPFAHLPYRTQTWPVPVDLEGTSPLSYLAPSPLTTASSPVSIADTPPSLVSTANTTPASSIVSASGLGHNHVSVGALLKRTHPDLEQYTDAWLATGVDLDQAKTWNETESHRFIDDDMVHQCPDLAHRPFHKWLLHLALAHLKADDGQSPPVTLAAEPDPHEFHQHQHHDVHSVHMLPGYSSHYHPQPRALASHEMKPTLSSSAPTASTSHFPFL